ncbi:MAG TPA: hypothetical protein VHW71_04105 [Steroidobacteraceae bacterium]|nr:hypothetical protein [Steroidobacteraceae bacterium]
MSSLLLLGAQLVQARPESRAMIARHQLSACMSRQMSLDKMLSYNEALRTCKQRLQPPKDTLAANAPTGPGTSH